MARRRRPEPPLPPRDGLGPARLRLPSTQSLPPGHQPPVRIVDFLIATTGDEPGVRRRIEEGEILLGDGTPVTAHTPYVAGESVYLYRDLPDEIDVPGELPILLHDEETGLLAVDKPPFLATMPRGSHVVQTAVVQLRRRWGNEQITPIHRLDRLTSGVLLLTTRCEVRSPYQRMVQRGGLAKTYLALAPPPEGHAGAAITEVLRAGGQVEVRNRIVKERGVLQARVVAGEPNAHTLIELLGEEVLEEQGLGDETLGEEAQQTAGQHHRQLARYRLTPLTGQTHQLRVHLAGLGLPIEGDPLYPMIQDVTPGDFSRPLRLLAHEVSFVDPITGHYRTIRSRRSLTG